MDDDLISCFVKSTTLTWVNDSRFSLEYEYDAECVIARECIRKGECLGEIMGEPSYVWDIGHNDFMFVSDDMVLDVSRNVPRTVLTLMRDENTSANESNCTIVVHQDHNASTTKFYVYATLDINKGDELVYSVPSWP